MIFTYSSLDDTSSLSSESATTTATTTSSSMSSSTCGDISGLTVQPMQHQQQHHSHHQSPHKSHGKSSSSSTSNHNSVTGKHHHSPHHHKSPKSRNAYSQQQLTMSNDLNRSTDHQQQQHSSPCPPATPTHCPVIRSPRKSSNVKKADSSIQTDSSALSGRSDGSNSDRNGSGFSGNNNANHSSLPVWKKYLQDQHIPIKSSAEVNNGKSTRSKLNDAYSVSNDSLRMKFSKGSNQMSNLGSNLIGSSLNGSSTIGSPYTPRLSNGKAVAVVRATSATTGRLPNPSKSHSSSRLKGGNNNSKANNGSGHGSSFSYSDAIYSDTEYMMSQRSTSSGYYSGKYSYLTSPVRLRSNNPRSGSSGLAYGSELGDRFTRDSSGYGQILSPWLQRNGFNLQRNALTEAESMESLNGLVNGNGSNGPTGSGPGNSLNSNSVGRRPASVTSKLNNGQSDLTGVPSRLPMTPNRSKLRGSNGSNILASPSLTSDLTRKAIEKEGDLHASALSLASNSTVFTQVEDKHNLEVRKLKRDLDQANEKVVTLTSQLNTNAHMVTAFEQSLAAMTARLQQLTSMSDRKDAELTKLRQMIDELSRQHKKRDGVDSMEGSPAKRNDKKNKEKKSLLIRRHTFASAAAEELRPHHCSKDSISSSSDHDTKPSNKSRKKERKYSADTIDGQSRVPVQSSKGWFRNSLTKAFRKSRSHSVKCHGSISDAEILASLGTGVGGVSLGLMDSCSVPNSPMMTLKSYRDITSEAERLEGEMIDELKQQLREKEKALTDLRLEALTAAHQLDNFKEMVNKMRAEMMSLKQDNDRLQRLLVTKSLASSKSSVLSSSNNGPNSSHSPNNETGLASNNKLLDSDDNLLEGGRKVTLILGTGNGSGLVIGTVFVSPETTWGILDALARKTVQDYLDRIDPDRSLGLSLESISFYEVGSERQLRNLRSSSSSSGTPELLPFGYIVNESVIKLGCRSYLESFVFETLIPKNIVQRFTSLLHEHKRLILYGPAGTGKTYLASKLAEYLVMKLQKGDRTSKQSFDSGDGDLLMFGAIPSGCHGDDYGNAIPPGSIATFNIDNKSANELKAYLSTLCEQFESCDTSLQDLPTVIILDNLHHVTSIDDLFNGNLTFHSNKEPFMIATMYQNNSISPNLQLNHNFRWLSCANHMEPVRGFLSRYLKRKLVTQEINQGSINLTIPTNMISVIEWIPKVWNHINHFLEVHHSSDVTLGPSIFITCPIDVESSQAWFNDLWNYSIHPYLIQAARDGLSKNGLRSSFEDPTDWIIRTYPWRQSQCSTPLDGPMTGDSYNLNRITLEDIQPYPGLTISSPIPDPLSDMLLRLQVATNNENSEDSNQVITHQQQQQQNQQKSKREQCKNIGNEDD